MSLLRKATIAVSNQELYLRRRTAVSGNQVGVESKHFSDNESFCSRFGGIRNLHFLGAFLNLKDFPSLHVLHHSGLLATAARAISWAANRITACTDKPAHRSRLFAETILRDTDKCRTFRHAEWRYIASVQTEPSALFLHVVAILGSLVDLKL